MLKVPSCIFAVEVKIIFPIIIANENVRFPPDIQRGLELMTYLCHFQRGHVMKMKENLSLHIFHVRYMPLDQAIMELLELLICFLILCWLFYLVLYFQHDIRSALGFLILEVCKKFLNLKKFIMVLY